MRLGILVLVLMMGMGSAVSVCIDNVAPPAPEGLSVSGSVGSILISWSAVIDSPACSGIAGYNISRNGVWIGWSDKLSFIDNASLGEGEYSYTVGAVDLVGGNAGASVKNDIGIDDDGGSSGGGRGSSYKCDVNWSCGEWGECVDGVVARACEDLNNCGTLYLKPVDSFECGSWSEEETEEVLKEIEENEGMSPPVIARGITGAVIGNLTSPTAGVTIFLLFLLLVGAYFWAKNKAK